MPRKSKDQKRAAKTSRIATRGAKRAANREVRKETRTERLAARKGISTDQAKQLQQNRKTRFKEFAAGGTENITTGRLRFGDGPSKTDPSAPKAEDTAATANKAFGGNDAQIKTPEVFNSGLTADQFSKDRLGMGQDPMTGRGGKAYNASVEVGDVEIDPTGFSSKTLSDSGYKPKGGGAYGS